METKCHSAKSACYVNLKEKEEQYLMAIIQTDIFFAFAIHILTFEVSERPSGIENE